MASWARCLPSLPQQSTNKRPPYRLHMAPNHPIRRASVCRHACCPCRGLHHVEWGEFYGTPEHNSLTLLKKYYKKYLDDAAKVVLNIKGATEPGLKPNGSAAYVKQSVRIIWRCWDPRGRSICLSVLGVIRTCRWPRPWARCRSVWMRDLSGALR